MERFNGIKLEKPLTRLKETAVMVRSMLAGERSDFDLTTLSSRGYRQELVGDPPPIYLAALRPKMIEMAAEYGDGVVFNLWPKNALPKMMEHVETGARRAGKRVEDLEIVNRYLVMVTDDVEEGRALFRLHYTPYYANPVYNEFLKWAGYKDEAEGVLAGWAARDRELSTGSITDELIDSVAIIGTADEVHARLKRLRGRRDRHQHRLPDRPDPDGGCHADVRSVLVRQVHIRLNGTRASRPARAVTAPDADVDVRAPTRAVRMARYNRSFFAPHTAVLGTRRSV